MLSGGSHADLPDGTVELNVGHRCEPDSCLGMAGQSGRDGDHARCRCARVRVEPQRCGSLGVTETPGDSAQVDPVRQQLRRRVVAQFLQRAGDPRPGRVAPIAMVMVSGFQGCEPAGSGENANASRGTLTPAVALCDLSSPSPCRDNSPKHPHRFHESFHDDSVPLQASPSKIRLNIRSPRSEWVIWGHTGEPPPGIEPGTYALREARNTALSALPALIAAHASRNAPGAQRAPDSRATSRATPS